MGTRKQLVTDDPYSGPYKATRLWNDVVLAFRENVPNGRHRRLMKVFDHCFSGSSATDWLLQYLQSSRNFGSDVKREKAVSLLNKLYSAGIFEEVKVSRSMQHKVWVQENRLYRLLPASPSKFKTTRLPLAPRNNLGPDHLVFSSNLKKSGEPKKGKSEAENVNPLDPLEKSKNSTATVDAKTNGNSSKDKEVYSKCRIVPKRLTSVEITDVWKKTFIFRMKKALGISRFADVLSEDLVNGSSILHNCLFLNKNGTVTNILPADQLPHWVLSAMKCLARWPEHHEEGLPSYPGFEKDIFCVVKSYFLGLREPLIPFQLYNAITNVFVMASSRSSNQDDAYASKDRESIIKSLWTTASLENVILDLSKKYGLMGSTDNFYEEDNPHDNDFSKAGFQSQDNVHFMHHVDEVHGDRTDFQHKNTSSKHWECKRGAPKLLLSRSAHSTSGLPQRHNTLTMRKFGSTPNLKISKYETAFGPDNRTVTRVFFQNGVCTDYEHCDEQHSSFSPIETHFSASTEDLGACQNPVNFDRAQSLECVTVDEFPRQNTISSNVVNLQRSKSLVSTSDFNGDGGFIARRKDHNSFQSRKCSTPHFNKSIETDHRSSLWASQDDLDTLNRLESVTEQSGSEMQLEHNQFPNRHIHLQSHSNLVKPTTPYYHLSPGPVIQNTSRNSVRTDDVFIRHSHLSPPLHQTSSHSFKDLSPTDSIGYGPGYRPVLDASKERSISCTNLSPQTHNPPQIKRLSRNKQHMTSTPLSPMSYNKSNHERGLPSGISLSYLTPFCKYNRKNVPMSHPTGLVSFPQTGLSEERAKTCLQLMTLLITPAKRRKLHMLFKMMVKMTANPNLCLDPSQTTRSLVLGTFYPAILRTEKESDFDEMLVLQLMSFMLDYYDDIFTPPSDLKSQVSDRLKQMQRPQISYSPGQSTPVQYCQQISVADYERERNVVSRQAMEELLENIIKDTKMPLKEKKKRLKQFHTTYPTIYRNRFPNPESEAQVIPATSKPKLKQPLIGKPMNQLRGLRL